MKAAKEQTKRIYLKFVDLLKLENQSTKNAFKEALDDFLKELKTMSQYIKHNEGKKILNDEPKDDKNNIKNNLQGVVVK